jgi:adenylyltransferase/sulfurtransferase
VGIGGLGCPVAQYLAAAGVGHLGMVDYDVVSVSNLHRQILYKPSQAGEKKATVSCQYLQQQNSDIAVVAYDMKLGNDNVLDLIKQYDIVLDCTDNFETRYLINDACVLAGIPVVYGAIYQYEGQVSVWNVMNDDHTRSPNYRDIYPDVNAAYVPNCAEGGVFPTLAGIIGTMMANETIKFITGAGTLLKGQLLLFDALSMQSRIVKTGVTTKTTIISLPAFAAVPYLSHAQLKANMDAYQLIDVRSAEEHAQYNIGGLHMSIQDLELNPPDNSSKPLVLYCTSGRRSAEAVKTLLSKSFDNIFSLEGGIRNW